VTKFLNAKYTSLLDPFSLACHFFSSGSSDLLIIAIAPFLNFWRILVMASFVIFIAVSSGVCGGGFSHFSCSNAGYCSRFS